MSDPLPPNPEDQKPLPPVPILPYRAKKDDGNPNTSLRKQVLAGFFVWILGFGGVVSAAYAGIQYIIPIPAFIIGTLVAISIFAIWVRVRCRWRGFIPGLLIGFAITCLIPAGIVAVVCFGGH